MNVIDLFKCPDCGSEKLEEKKDHLHCPNCQAKWAVRDGIYDFRKKHKVRWTGRGFLISWLGTLAAFVLSRVLYDRAGIQFQGDPYLGYWHFIDPQLMITDLWRSVYHLHSQPPLMNLLAGVILQASPSNYQQIFHIAYFITGLFLACGIYLLGIHLKLESWLSALVTIWFMASPGTVLYEHLLAYGYPLTALLTLSGVFLFRFAASGGNRWGGLFFFVLATITLLWGFFHIIWFFFSILIALALIPERKKVILAALLPFAIVTGWYSKNLFQVGQFTASSWAGMNFSKIATFRMPEKERKQLVRSGELSSFALIPPFRNPLVYLKLLPGTRVTGISILDEVYTSLGTRNFHHLVYAEASHNYLRDALRVIYLMPEYYLRSIGQAFYIYFHSPSDFDPIAGNRDVLGAFDLWWNRLFYGQWKSDETSIERNSDISFEHVGWWIVAGFLIVIAGSTALLWMNRGNLAEPENVLILFMAYNILFVTLVGNAMDIGENNRFRYTIDPFLSILLVFFLRNLIDPASPGKPEK